MNKLIVVTFCLGLFGYATILLMTGVHAGEKTSNFTYGKVVFTDQDLTIEVEVASTAMQRSKGLMYRDYLAQNRGMLFVFEHAQIQRVWMRNTLIPLDIVFISRQRKVVSIIKGLQPCLKAPCDIYESMERAKYMLEINAGEIESKGIRVGQMLKIEVAVRRPATLPLS